MTPAEKLAIIDAALDAGRTVYLRTFTRAIKITPKLRDRWNATGRPVVKVGPGIESRLESSTPAIVAVSLQWARWLCLTLGGE